ncbi:hypothetical protein ABZ707_26620 [Streptomyces sp. NPDC006923]|uniref:hypothetical protein n=1 Tax=Streptomyces sp. NPDC006923 TaxID=3155355 RepID=UPI0033DD2D86
MISRTARWRTLRVAAAAVLGAGGATALYTLNEAGSGYAFVLVGAVLGALTALGIDLYRRTARLTEVRISIPQFSELTFVVNDDAQRVSWQLFVESVTRVSIQRLEDDEGLIREALTSLYGLFTTTRDILRAARPSAPGDGLTVEYLAVNLLNRELRPILSKWHPRLREFENAHPELPESAWPYAAECRSELRRAQAHTREYVIGFARLAGVREPELMLGVGGGDPAV